MLAATLTGRRVLGFRRRGKYILMRIEGGDSVLLHLGMSGRVVLDDTRANRPPERHEHVVIALRDGCRVGLVDPRRFGGIDLVPTAQEDQHKLLAGLGVEPLESGFTARYLAQALVGRRTAIKAALLDQRLIAGLGNIYVCEALYRARLHPALPAGVLSKAAVARLVKACRDVLSEAVAAGGSSLRDYVQPDGELGYFQHAWRVYGREGEPCGDCAQDGSCVRAGCAGVARIVQSARSSFFCPRLQRFPEGLGDAGAGDV
jgi:formamidopyrimidine-DNA glycosylase